MNCVMPLSLYFNQNVFQGFFSLQYDLSGGSANIPSLVVVDSVLGAISSLVMSLGRARPGDIALQRAIFFYVHLCSFF